jgi:hypothetical protein
MGTRHLICVVLNGAYKVAQYGQWDGYPTGQGKTVLEFLQTLDLEAFKNKVGVCQFGTDAEIDAAYKSFSTNGGMSMAQSAAFKVSKFGHLSRDTGAAILPVIMSAAEPLLLQDSIDFAGQSLFCEWAYVIDLDKGVLEVYEGFNTEPLPEGARFAEYGPTPAEIAAWKPKYEGQELYYPVRLAKSYPLNDLPTMEVFVADLTPQAEEDEEAA